MLRRLLLLSTALVCPAIAQETALDAVTATATRTPQVAGDIGAPVSVVPREELRRRQATSLNDILRDMPGVEVDGLPRASVQQPQIRGLGADRVITTIDGVRQNFNSGHRGRFFFEPELLRQVDVLRGPASMLYGSGAIGGVIALRTIEAEDIIRPGRATGFFLSQGYDSNGGRFRSTAAAAFRAGDVDGLAAFSRHAGRNLTDGAGQTIPFTDPTTNTGMLRLGWNPAPGMRIAFGFINRDERQRIPIAANTISATDIADRVVSSTQTSLTFTWQPPGNDLIDMRAQLYRNSVGIDERRVVPNDSRRDLTELETWGLSVQNTARFSLAGWDRHALTFGVDGFRDNQLGLRAGAPRGQFPNAQQDIYSAFVQDELRVGPVTLRGGFRFDSIQQTTPGQRPNNSSRVSPSVSLAWQVTPWAQPYVSYAEAYRAPNLSQLYTTGVHFPIRFFPTPLFNVFVPNPDLRPETSRNVELGVNLRFRDVLQAHDSVRVRAAMFRNSLDDFIETVVGATTTTQRNITRARIQGLELEAQYDSPRWFGSIGGSIIRGDNLTTGQPLSLIPADKLSFTIGHRLPNHGLTLGTRLQLVRDQGLKPRDAATGQQPPSTPGYVLSDLFLSWAPPEGALQGWRLDFGVANLFNARYRRASWDAGIQRAPFFDLGRNVQVRLSANF